jgi:hypothetical protein
MVYCDRGYVRPSRRARVFLRQAQKALGSYLSTILKDTSRKELVASLDRPPVVPSLNMGQQAAQPVIAQLELFGVTAAFATNR